MKVFISYRFTGEDPAELAVTIGQITETLRGAGHIVYSSLEDEEWFRAEKRTNAEIMRHAFAELDTSDVLLAFIRSNEKSEGMLVEIGYAFAKGKRVALALKNGIATTSIAQMADPVIIFDSLDELCDKLRTAL